MYLHPQSRIWRCSWCAVPQARALKFEAFPASVSGPDIYPPSPLREERVTARWRYAPCLPLPTVGTEERHLVLLDEFETN